MSRLERELVELYSDVYFFVNSRVNDQSCAEDITQSVMEKAIEKYDTLRKKESLKSWVMQIANNKIKAYYNDLKKINAMFVFQENDDGESISIDIYNIADLKADILDMIVSEQDQVNIICALNNLEEKYKEVIRLNYICEYNFIEISEILSVNVNTVRTWAARGLIKLREEFEKMNAGEKNEAIL